MDHSIENNETTPPPVQRTGGRGKLAFLKNKYLIAAVCFLVWMVFFDPKDISSAISRWKKYKELQASEQQLTKKIDESKKELGQLKSNVHTIEKYAREKYLMKKDNEDLFLVPEPSAENKQ